MSRRLEARFPASVAVESVFVNACGPDGLSFWSLWDGRVPRTRVGSCSLVRGRRAAWSVLCRCGEQHVVAQRSASTVFGCGRAFFGAIDGVAVHRFAELPRVPSDAELWAEAMA